LLGSIKILQNAVTRIQKDSKTNVKLFLSGPLGDINNNISKAINLLKESKHNSMELNSVVNDTVVGLYLNFMFTDYLRQLEVVEMVFGDKESSAIQIGHLLNCAKYFVNQDIMQYLQRLDFITCSLEEKENVPPEEQAAVYIASCEKYQKVAQSLNLTAKIMCSVEYASKGHVQSGRVVLSLDFYRFWRQLANQVKANNTHAPLIMEATVDVQNFQHLSQPVSTTGYYHTGWWRKTHAASVQPGAFIEKIDEIPFGRISGKCSKICQACNNDNECCFGTCLSHPDFTITSAANTETICRKEETICPSLEEGISRNNETLIFNSQPVINYIN